MASGSEIKIVLWNLQGPQPSKGGVRMGEREEVVEKIIEHLTNNNHLTPDFYLVQETATRLVKKIGKTDGKGTKRAQEALVVRDITFDCLADNYIDIGDLQKVQDGLRFQAKDQIELGRLHCYEVCDSHFSVDTLIVSWHGPKNSHTFTERSDKLISLLKILRKLAESKKCKAIILGGDFNLKAKEAKAKLAADKDMIDFGVENKSDTNIDYVIVWPRTNIRRVGDIQEIPVDFKEVDVKVVFNHPILLYKLQYSQK